MTKFTRITSLLFFAISEEKSELWRWWGWSSIPKIPKNSKFAMSLQYFKKEVRDKVDFLQADKHQSFSSTLWASKFPT